jgi:hypothetical protein
VARVELCVVVTVVVARFTLVLCVSSAPSGKWGTGNWLTN